MDIELVKALAPVGTVLVGAAGLFLAWKSRREAQLRQADVLKWSLETIALLQRAVLSIDDVCFKPEMASEKLTKIGDIGSDLSIAAEQGRLFFKNSSNPHGKEKQTAYRGLRPEILDQLVIASKVCLQVGNSDDTRRWQLRYLALCAEQRFVSLAQSEVGRSRVSSVVAAASGSGVRLDRLLAQIDPDQVERSRNRFQE